MNQSWMISAAIAAVLAQPVAAQTPPAGGTTYPASLDREVLTAWLRSATDLDPAAVVSVRPSDIIGIVSSEPVGATGGRQHHALIRSEVINAKTVSEAGHASWSADVDIDCEGGRGKVNRILDYPMRNLKGTTREAVISARWLVPPPGTHLDAVIRAICEPAYQRPLVPTLQVAGTAGSREATAPRATVLPDSPPVAAAPKPAPPPPPASAQAAPPRPAPSPSPPALVAAQAAPPPPPGPRAAVRTAAQVSAAASEALARQALAATRRAVADEMEGLSTRIERATVGGRTYYRALVYGFASQAEATRFCKAAAARGKDCFLRASTAP